MPDNNIIDQLNKLQSSKDIKVDPRLLKQENDLYIGREASSLGQSKFDENVPVTIATSGELFYLRGQKQGNLDKIGNGIIQASGKAVSSFVNGTAGTIYGIGSALSNGKFSNLYDNKITRNMDDLNSSLTEGLPLYNTKDYETSKWYEKLTKANLWWGDVLGGIGYTAGSLATGYSTGSIYRNIAKELGAVGKTSKALNQLSVATTSAIAESGDEGRQGKDEFINKTLADRKVYYQSIGQDIPQEEIDKINALGTELGNSIFLINVPIVAGSNFLQFGKTMTNFNAEKRSIGELAKEVEGKIERKATGEFQKVQLSPLEERVSKIINIGKQPVEEGTQEQIQLATTKGAEDFYTKRFKGEKTNIFDSALEGLKEAYGTDAGWTNFVVGALSAGISGAAIPNSQLREAFGNDDKAINTALEILNKHNPKSVYKELIQSDNRAKAISEDMAAATIKNDKFEFNNSQNDLLTNYVLSRLKTGQFESLQEDLDAFKTASKEEFAQIFGTEPSEANKNSVAELVQDRINKANEIKKAYESVNNQFPDISEGNKERLTHASFTIDDSKSRKQKLYQDLMNITMKENSGLLVKFGENIMSNLPGSEKYTPVAINDEFKKELSKLNPLRQPEVNNIVNDIERLNSREQEYTKLFNQIAQDEATRTKLDKADADLETKTSKGKGKEETTNIVTTSVKPGDNIQFRGDSKSQIVESVDEENDIVFIKGDETPHHKNEFYIPAKLSATGPEILNNTDITTPYTGDRKDGSGVHKPGTKERIAKVLNNNSDIQAKTRVKLTKKTSVEGNIERGNKHFLATNPKEEKATLAPNTELDVVYELQDENGEWFDAFHGTHSGQYTIVDSKGNTKAFHFTNENKNKAKQLFKIRNSDGSIRDLTDEDLNELIDNQAKLDAVNKIFKDVYNKTGETTLSAKELKDNYGVTIFTKKGSLDKIFDDNQKPSLSDISKANIDGEYYIFNAQDATSVDQLIPLGDLSKLSKAEKLLSTIDNPDNFISESKSRYMAIGREPNGMHFLFSIDTPLLTNDEFSSILESIQDKEEISTKEKNKINDDLNTLIHIISPKGTRLELKIDTTKEDKLSKLQIVESKNNKKTYYDIPFGKNTSLSSVVKNANKAGLVYLKETSFRKSVPQASNTRNIANEELAKMFISNVTPNIFNYSKIGVDISLPKNVKPSIKQEIKIEEPKISEEKSKPSKMSDGELEAKKADIERRRQEELKERVVYDRFPTVEDGEFKIIGDPNNRIYRINENTGRPQELDESNGLWSNTALSPNLFMESTKRSGFEKSKNKINAKYDAELAALGNKPTISKEQTHSEVKKQVHSDFNNETGLNTVLVGSVSRSEAKEGSDIDIVLEGMPHVGKEKLNEQERVENSNYAYDTLRHLAEKGVITEFELKANGFGLNFKYKGQEFQVVPNPSAKPKDNTKPAISKEDSNSEVEAKKADIERRRQEELKNEIWNNSGTKFTGKSFVAKDGNTYTIEESELKSGDKVIKVKDKNGKTVSSAYFTKNEDGTYSIKKGTRVESEIQGIGLASAIYNYFDNNIGKIKRTDTTTDEGDNLWNSNKNRINAKYDAELKALEQQNTSNLSEIEAKIADLEKRAEEEGDFDKQIALLEEKDALIDELLKGKNIIDDTDRITNKLSTEKAKVLIDIPQAEENIRNMITPDDVITFDNINEVLQNIENKGETWGFFRNKIIYLSNKAEKGTEFHEVFHYVFRRMLSDAEINRIYTIAKTIYKAPTMEQLKELKNSSTANKDLSLEELKQLYYEEKMADSFVDWKHRQANLAKLGIIGKLIKKIQGLINWITRNDTELTALFESINQGSFKNSDIVSSNRFNNYSSPVFKLLINGEKVVNEGKVYTYASLEEGKQIVRTLTGKVVKGIETSTKDVNTIIDQVIAEEFKFNNVLANKTLLESLPSKERIRVFNKLKQNQYIYSNPEAISVLKDQINKLLDTFNFTNEEIDLDEQITNEENERKSIDFDKNAINIGGFDSLNKEIRAYIGTTLYKSKDILGRDVEVAVDPQVVYQGIERNLASTAPGEMMNKLKVFSEYNPQTKAVYNRLISDVGYDETLGIAKVNPQLLQQFLNSFTKEKLNYLQILIKPETGDIKVINANTKDAKHLQFSQWFRNYNSLKEPNSEENITKLTKASQYLASGDVSKESSIRTAFRSIGIDLSEAYVKFSLLSISNPEDNLVTLNSDVKPLTEEDVNQIVKTLKSSTSPFEELEKGQGNIGRILKIAEGNANFDENITSSNFQDSKGKTRWSYISPSLALERTRELEGILSTEEGRKAFKQELATKYSHDYSFNDENYLLNHSEANNLFSNFRLDFTGDIRQEETGKEGVTFKSIDDRAFKLVQYSLFAKQTKRGDLTVAKFYPKVLEASASAYSIELPVEEFYKKSPTTKAIDTLYNQFLQEVKRISITQKELENPDVQKIKDYHVGKQNGFKLFYFRWLENTELGKQILNKAVSYTSREDFNDIEDKIKEELVKFVDNEIQQEIKLLGELGIYSKDQNLLPKELRNSPEQSIGNFYLNSLINLNAFNDLIELNPAFSKGSVDNVKRAKRLIASKVSFGKGQHIVGFIKEPTAEGLTKKIDIADAQSYIDINHFKFILLREGKLSSEINDILNKINDGEELSWEEVTILKDKQVMLNSIKTVTAGPVDYHKMSDVILTKKLTSIKDENGIWQPKPGKEYLHNLREQLEELSRIATQDKFKAIGQKFDWNQNMTIEQINQIIPSRIMPESASKLLTPVPADLTDGKYTFNKSNTRYVENKYSGRQVDTPSGKTEIVYGTQLIQLIDSEQDDNTVVSFNGEDIKIGQLRKIYQKLLSQARTNSVEQAKKFLGKLVDGKLTEKEETRFRKKLLNTLEESGADDSLLQFFGLDPKYNLNLPNTLNKYEQLFLAHFSKGVLGQKIAGLKLTLVSGNGFNIYDKESKSYRELKYNPSGLSEVALPAFTRELHNLKEGDLVKYEDILSMFGQRIPTQDKHSMIAFKVVEFLPSEYGSIGIFPKEVVELSGADFDIDSIFVERKDFYSKNGKLIPFGTAKTLEGKKEEYIQDQLQNNKDLKKLIKFNKGNIQQAFNDLQLPYSLEEYKKATNDGKIEISNAVINNQLVDANIIFLTNEKMVSEGIPQTPATTDRLSTVRDKILELQGKNKDNQFTLNSVLGQYQAWKSNATGKENVGPAANANIIRSFLYKAKVHLQKNTFKPEFNGKSYFDFSKNKDSDKNRIQDTLSTILSSMTDNAKDPMAGDLNLSLTSLGPALQLVSLGVDLYDVMLLVNNPLVREYTQAIEKTKTVVKSKEDQKVRKSDIKENILKKYKLSIPEDLSLNTNDLETSIKSNLFDNIKALQVFTKLEEQGVYWQHLSKILALNKGLPASFEETEAIKNAINAFKVNSEEQLPEEAPFDIRNALEGTHVLNNIKLFNDILDVSKQYFITQTPIFNSLIEDMSSIIRNNISNKNAVLSQVKKDFLSYIAINAYKHSLNRPLNQSLLVGDNNITVQLKTLLKDNPELKDNKLIRFLSVDNSKNIPILTANTRIKLTGNQIEELTDSFRELFNNEETNQFAKNLYEYLIIKDNLQFKNDSFIKFISPFMFKKISNNLDVIGNILSDGGDIKEVTGFNSWELVNNFSNIWARYIDNQQYIERSYSLEESLKEKFPKEYVIFNKQLYKLNGNKNFYDKISTIGNDIQSPYGFSIADEVIKNNNFEVQNQIKIEELTPVSMETISPILEDLKEKFNLDYEIVNEPNADWVGQYRNIDGINKVVINSAKVQLDTPFHEFAHPFVRIIRETNKPLWNSLIVELERDEVGKKVMQETIKNYPELSLVNQKEEAIVTAIGLYATEKLDKEKNKGLIDKLLKFLNDIIDLISNTINPSSLPKMKLRELGKIMSSKTKIDISKAKDFIAKNEISKQKEASIVKPDSPYIEQQVFFSRRLAKLEKELKGLKEGTDRYVDILSEIEEIRTKLTSATPENEHEVLLELGNSTLDKAEEYISELEEGSSRDTGRMLEYTSEVLSVFADFEDLEGRTKKLYRRYFKFANKHNLNNIKEFYTGKEELSQKNIDDQNEDISTIRRGVGALSDLANHIARTVGSIIKAAQNKVSTLNKQSSKEIQKKVDGLDKWAKNNGMKLSDVYEMFVQEERGTSVLAKPYTTEFYNDLYKAFSKLRDENTKEEGKQWLRENVIKTNEGWTTKLEKYQNKNYQKIQSTPELKEFYDYYQNKIQESSGHLAIKLNSNFIPNIKKDSLKDRVKGLNPFKNIKTGDFVGKEELFADALPLHYNKSIPFKEKSTNLGSSLLQFVMYSNNYSEMTKILPEVRLLQEQLAYKTYPNGEVKERFFTKSSNPNVEIKGEDTNLYKMVSSVIDMQVKGKMKKEEGKYKINDLYDENDNKIGEKQIDFTSMADNMLKYNSLLRIGFSPITAITNWMFGDISNVIEAIGGQFFGVKDLYNASNIFFKQNFNKDSNLNKLLQKLNPLQELDDYDYIENIKLTGESKKISVDKLEEYMYAPQKIGEKFLQSRTMLALMIKEGLITSKGELTEKFNSLSEKELSQLSDKIQRVNQMIHGRYSQKEAATLQQSVLYRLASQFRKWIPAAIENRIGTKQWDNRLQAEVEGRYRTIARLFMNLKDTRQRLTNGEMTQLEIYNLKKTLSELIIMGATMLLYAGIKGGDDDKKRQKNPFVKLSLTLLDRAAGDLQYFYSPSKLNELPQNTVPLAKTTGTIMQAISYIPYALYLGDSQYKRGSNKGMNKFYVTAAKVTPGIKVINDVRRMANSEPLEELK